MAARGESRFSQRRNFDSGALMEKKEERPFIAVNIAMTADGKIAPDTRRFHPFGSARDQQLMMELRSRADALMAGARTLGAANVTLGPGGKKYQRKRIEA